MKFLEKEIQTKLDTKNAELKKHETIISKYETQVFHLEKKLQECYQKFSPEQRSEINQLLLQSPAQS